MRRLDYALGGLLALSAAGHTAGTFMFYQFGTEVFVWSLAASLAAFLLFGINLTRIRLDSDQKIAILALTGNLAWAVIVLLFGMTLESLIDPRVIMHEVAALGLAAMSFRNLRS